MWINKAIAINDQNSRNIRRSGWSDWRFLPLCVGADAPVTGLYALVLQIPPHIPTSVAHRPKAWASA